MRLTALFPFACACGAFILSMLCLFAGSKPNFMEGYNIVTLNTSTLGHNLVNATKTSSSSSSQPTSLLSWLEGEGDNITSTIEGEIESELDSLVDDIADKLAQELGIHQWYSLHLMDMCEGSYSPNATASGASKNSNMTCTNRTAMYHFDPISSINASLASSTLGKELGLDLSKVNWPDALTDGIRALNGLSSVTFIFYAIGIALSGLAIITSIIAIFLHGSRLVSFANWGIAGLAFLCLGIASGIVTAIMVKVSNLVNQYGNDAGVYAYRGSKFLALTWAAVGLMLVATLSWMVEFCIGRRRERRVYTEKTTGGRGWKGRF